MLLLVRSWNKRCLLLLLFATAVRCQVPEGRPKANSIKPGLLAGGAAAAEEEEEQAPTAASDRSSTVRTSPVKKFNIFAQQVYPCSNDKECSVGSYCHSPQQAPSRCLACRRRKKRCHRDAMCCPGNRCHSYICMAISESVISPHISALDEHNKLSAKDPSWKKSTEKTHTKHSLKGHEGDPCLRTSDCSEGYCCARHFWTKICKPVLRLGEVCTKQRKKGSHSLEIFQRCDCAKGLSCKVWKDGASSSKSRLHMCQKI
ncbi:dickkopf-related protein 2 isoform X1 [Syngnathoides biaculeatus]|uniref:dickkopf-related protein 2 isoform X1 n=1 Tax=Syngnathoides biaculeatus TaxID=300417 RepID=UPI002ADDBA42|nr:dickkopf-related protein 2 isoform X1 [Syngnathoides biaculeatus]